MTAKRESFAMLSHDGEHIVALAAGEWRAAFDRARAMDPDAVIVDVPTPEGIHAAIEGLTERQLAALKAGPFVRLNRSDT